MRHPFGETIVRQRATATVSSYSNEATDISWAAPDELSITGVAIEPVGTFESTTGEAGRERVDFDLRLYLPYEADVRPLDRVVVRGVTYEVTGERSDWRNPFSGDEPGSVVGCKRVEG